MNISKTTILIIAFLLTTVAIFVFDESEPDHPATTNSTQTKEQPSNFIQNGRFIIYDENGYSTTLTSTNAEFFPNSDYVRIQSPAIDVINASGDRIKLTANSGHYNPISEKLILRGNVSIFQSSPPEDAWSAKGEEFTLDNKRRFISTDQAVTIKKGMHYMNATGLNAWLDEKTIDLLSNVRGQYVFTH